MSLQERAADSERRILFLTKVGGSLQTLRSVFPLSAYASVDYFGQNLALRTAPPVEFGRPLCHHNLWTVFELGNFGSVRPLVLEGSLRTRLLGDIEVFYCLDWRLLVADVVKIVVHQRLVLVDLEAFRRGEIVREETTRWLAALERTLDLRNGLVLGSGIGKLRNAGGYRLNSRSLAGLGHLLQQRGLFVLCLGVGHFYLLYVLFARGAIFSQEWRVGPLLHQQEGVGLGAVFVLVLFELPIEELLVVLHVAQVDEALQFAEESVGQVCKLTRDAAQLLISFKHVHQNVLLEHPRLQFAVRELHDTDTILNPVFPCAFVNGAIRPGHHSESTLQVFLIIALVVAARLPLKFAFAVLHVQVVLTFVGVGLFGGATFFPNSFPVFFSILEQTRVSVSVVPSVLAEALRPPIAILAEVHVAICEYVRALTMPQTVLPLPFILVTVVPFVYAKPMRFIVGPLSRVVSAL